MELDELLDLTVDEQKDELENLSKKKLEKLREAEERQTAIDNIDSELSNRPEITEKAEPEPEEDNKSEIEEDFDETSNRVDGDIEKQEVDVEQLARKVDYLIEKCKSTSEEAFENYEA